MAATLAEYEKVIFNLVDSLTARPVRYANERRGQPGPGEPYVTVLMLAEVQAGLHYARYFNRPDPELDLDTQMVRPSEITASINFIGGNARGELSIMLTNMHGYDPINLLASEGVGYLRDSGSRDLTEDIGGEREQRAQVDITFSINILPDRTETPSIQEVEINAIYKNPAGETALETEITVP